MPQSHDAFISYSHAVDGRLAPALEQGLERLARPWNRLHAIAVFRDHSDLSLADHLWATISGHLDRSRYLVLLACPESASSKWVNREVAHWCDTKGTDQLLLIWTGGDLGWDESLGDFGVESSAIPPALRARFVDEPLYLDLRWARDAADLSLHLSNFRAAVAKVASPIRAMPPDELEGEDIRIHRRTRRLARAAVAALAALTLFAAASAVVAVSNAHRADRRTREAVARQVGLAALDLPAGQLDQALLMSLASGDLAPDSEERFQPTQVLIGRYSRLESILHAGTTEGFSGVRGIGLSSDGSTVFATLGRADGSLTLATWTSSERVSAALEPLPVRTGVRLDMVGGGKAVLVGADGPAPRRGEPPGRLTGLPGRIVALDRWSGGAWLADDGGGTVSLVSTVTGESLTTVTGGPDVLGAVGRRRAAALVGGDLATFDATTGAPEATAAGVPAAAAIAVGEGDDAAVVTAAADGRILRWDRRGDRLALAGSVMLPSGVGAPRWLAVARDGERVLIVGTSGTALIEFGSGRVQSAEGGGTAVAEVDPSGRFVALGGSRLSVWDLDSGQRVVSTAQVANAVAWSGPCDARPACRLAVAGVSIEVIDPIRETQIRLVDEIGAQAIAISGDGSRIVSGGWGSTVAVWSVEPLVDDSTREVLTRTAAGSAADAGANTDSDVDPRCLGDLSATSPAGDHVVVFAVADARLAVCAADGGGPPVAVGRLDVGSAAVTSVAVDDGGNVVLGRAPGIVDYYAAADGSFRTGTAVDVRVGGEHVEVSALAMRGGVVVAGIRFPGSDSTPARVLIWRLAEQEPTTFTIDYSDVAAVAVLDADAGAVIVAGRDAPEGPVTLQLWETVSRRRVGRAFTGLEGEVITLVGAGTAVEGSDRSGHAFRWHLDRDPAHEVCEIVGRPLTSDEWASFAGGALSRYAFRSPCP